MTHYDMLEVTHTASPEVIHAAYMALVKKYHPDLYQDEQDKAEAEERMKQINDAYRVLSSSALRADYDRQLQQPIDEPQSQYTKAANAAQEENSAKRRTPPKRRKKPIGSRMCAGRLHRRKGLRQSPKRGEVFTARWCC